MYKPILLLVVLATAMSLQIAHTPTQSLSLDLPTLRSAELAIHNADRALHGCPALKLDASLNSAAQTYATYLATTHQFTHSPDALKGKYGENLYKAWGYPTLVYKSGTASNSWYTEAANYDYQTGTSLPGKASGHFTAMIWKSVTSVGFGYAIVAEKNGYAIYVVANYSPTPNVSGQYLNNVPPPK
jgi:glioma pathogenesis-related protein 2